MFSVSSHVDVDGLEQIVHSALKHCIISLFAKPVGSQQQLSWQNGITVQQTVMQILWY